MTVPFFQPLIFQIRKQQMENSGDLPQTSSWVGQTQPCLTWAVPAPCGEAQERPWRNGEGPAQTKGGPCFLYDFNGMTALCGQCHLGVHAPCTLTFPYCLEEADYASPRRYLPLVLLFFQSFPLGEATLVNSQKDNQPTHLPPFSVSPLLFRGRKDRAT